MNEYVRKPAGNALGDIIKNKISDTASERIEIYALYFYDLTKEGKVIIFNMNT